MAIIDARKRLLIGSGFCDFLLYFLLCLNGILLGVVFIQLIIITSLITLHQYYLFFRMPAFNTEMFNIEAYYLFKQCVNLFLIHTFLYKLKLDQTKSIKFAQFKLLIYIFIAHYLIGEERIQQ